MWLARPLRGPYGSLRSPARLPDVYAGGVRGDRASGSDGNDVDTLSDARDTLVESIEGLRLTGDDVPLTPVG